MFRWTHCDVKSSKKAFPGNLPEDGIVIANDSTEGKSSD